VLTESLKSFRELKKNTWLCHCISDGITERLSFSKSSKKLEKILWLCHRHFRRNHQQTKLLGEFHGVEKQLHGSTTNISGNIVIVISVDFMQLNIKIT